MGNRSRTDSCRCVKCFNDRSVPRGGHRWIDAVEAKGSGVLLRCKRCGHEYVSRSKAAFNKLDTLISDAAKSPSLRVLKTHTKQSATCEHHPHDRDIDDSGYPTCNACDSFYFMGAWRKINS